MCNVDTIKSQKETTQGRKNNQKKYSINIDSKIVKIKENDSKDFISLPSSIEYQKENKVATIKSEKKGMKGRVSVQGVKSLGGHFACLCREFEFCEVKKKLLLFFKKKMEILLHF